MAFLAFGAAHSKELKLVQVHQFELRAAATTNNFLIVTKIVQYLGRVVKNSFNEVKAKDALPRGSSEGDRVFFAEPKIERKYCNLAPLTVCHLEILRQEEIKLQRRQERFVLKSNVEVTGWRRSFDGSEDTGCVAT
ncbi:hypothetical protein GCM10027046_26440 [Uliginosibacterium flavum]